jgi:hypothetical protein
VLAQESYLQEAEQERILSRTEVMPEHSSTEESSSDSENDSHDPVLTDRFGNTIDPSDTLQDMQSLEISGSLSQVNS